MAYFFITFWLDDQREPTSYLNKMESIVRKYLWAIYIFASMHLWCGAKKWGSDGTGCIANPFVREFRIIDPADGSLVTNPYYIQLNAELHISMEDFRSTNEDYTICTRTYESGSSLLQPIFEECELSPLDQISVPAFSGRNILSVSMVHRNEKQICESHLTIECCAQLNTHREAALASNSSYDDDPSGSPEQLTRHDRHSMNMVLEKRLEAIYVWNKRFLENYIPSNSYTAGLVPAVLQRSGSAIQLWEPTELNTASVDELIDESDRQGAKAYSHQKWTSESSKNDPALVTIAIGIKSGALNIRQRNIIRQTWFRAMIDLHEHHPGIFRFRPFFLVGDYHAAQPIRDRGGGGRVATDCDVKQDEEEKQEGLDRHSKCCKTPNSDTHWCSADADQEEDGKKEEPEDAADSLILLIEQQLLAEQAKYRDMLLAAELPVPDSYHSLPQKVLSFLSWVQRQQWQHLQQQTKREKEFGADEQQCPEEAKHSTDSFENTTSASNNHDKNFTTNKRSAAALAVDYIVICDDDVHVDVWELAHLLLHHFLHNEAEGQFLYAGEVRREGSFNYVLL